MVDEQKILDLLELGWSYRRIQRKTGVDHEAVVRAWSPEDTKIRQSVHRLYSKTRRVLCNWNSKSITNSIMKTEKAAVS